MNKLLTRKQLAARLQVSVSTLRYWEKQGKAPPMHQISGRTVRYDEDEVEQWIKQTRQPEPEKPAQ